MEGYPVDYIGHNLPFVLLFGIGPTEFRPPLPAEKEFPLLQEKGIYISSELPSVTGSAADQLLANFYQFDARDASWNSRPGKGKMGNMGFTFRTVGRAFTLPPRKANPPSVSATEENESYNPQRPANSVVALHSPLSPLTPESPIFPDGIMSSLWFSKHQVLLPSAMISFFNFTMEASTSTLQDNRLKSEINALKTSVASSSYKFRLLVVLVADGEGSEMLTNDRLANIRRGTNLDPRSLFLMSYGLSSIEVGGFVGTILASLQSSCVEYYRDLSKHARRKRNRGTAPSPTLPPVFGTSHTLSAQGWTVRYETKLGYFAEFRQEMDAAGHNYEAAYESLVDGEVFQSIANWSPRFNEARMLADVLATRILRCLLWTGQTTSAVQSWANHRWRMLDLVDQKGKGSATYGWQAWEARWSSVMAELIERVDVPIFHVPDHPRLDPTQFEVPDIYAIPEKSFAQEDRLPPWDLLHHEGYWYRRSANRTRARRRLAMLMPKEDRIESDPSSPSTTMSNTQHYDTYLCPEPQFEFALGDKDTFDHSALLIETVGKAAIHFSQREQKRAVERAGLEIAQEHMKSGRWAQAWTLLGPLWRNLSWRKAGWWMLVEEVSWAVRACARNLDDGETLIAVEWELLSNRLSTRANWNYNFSNCLEGLDIEERPHAIIDADLLAPCMTASFTFGTGGGHVGEVLPMQLTITSCAQPNSVPIRLSEIELSFEGGLTAISISHAEDSEALARSANELVELFDIVVSESKMSTTVSSPTTPVTPKFATNTADLIFQPGTKKVFLLNLVPRDSGEVKASQVVLSIREETFYFDIGMKLQESTARVDWWYSQDALLKRSRLDLDQHTSIAILPKPPKLQIELPTWKGTYYCNEMVYIAIRLRNEEADTVDIRLNINLQGLNVPSLKWHSEGTDEDEAPSLEGRHMGQIEAGRYIEETVSFHAPTEMVKFSFEIQADYTLVSDPNTPISKSLKDSLPIEAPFEANYEFQPRIHPEPWPSYFNIDTIDTDDGRPRGLKQQWAHIAKIVSFAAEPLLLKHVKLKEISVENTLLSPVTTTTPVAEEGGTIHPNSPYQHVSILELQKASLGDVHYAALTFELEITWQRVVSFPSAIPTTMTLLVPPLTIPFGEPRLVASCDYSTQHPSLINMTYTIENPSMHTLTFNLTMEASEDFAFSGSKSASTQLLPLSRKEIRYNILPLKQGIWIRPSLKCVDIGFGKVLRCLPGERCRSDRQKGLVVWAPGEAESVV